MHKKHAKSVTIGILAHNNSADILYLLRSILKQKGDSFSIDEIVVFSDGSTDNTAEKVQKYADSYPIIRLISDSKRKGSSKRLQQLFSFVKSNCILVFKGNVVLHNAYVIDLMVQELGKAKLSLVSPSLIPMPVKGTQANLIKLRYELIQKMIHNTKNGSSIYNFSGRAFGIRTDLAKKVVFPKAVSRLSPYLYLMTKTQNRNFSYVSEASVYFRTPSTFRNFIKISQAVHNERKTLITIFGADITREYKVPLSVKFVTSIKWFFKNPLNIAVILFLEALKFLPERKRHQAAVKNWTLTSASKNKVHYFN